MLLLSCICYAFVIIDKGVIHYFNCSLKLNVLISQPKGICV